jgi:hypothetical protein
MTWTTPGQWVTTGSDRTPPVISLIGGDVILNLGDSYQELGHTAIDAIDGDVTRRTIITLPDFTTVGTKQVEYDSFDIRGNTSTAIRNVLVTDDETSPVIALTPNQTSFTIYEGESFTPPSAIATDNQDSDAIVTPADRDGFDNSIVGTYHFDYDHDDQAGNSAETVTVTVTVEEITVALVIKAVAEMKFTVNENLITAFKDRANRDILNFTQIDPNFIVNTDSDGFFDFDNNNVTSVEIIAGDKSINSAGDFVSWSGADLSIEFGALDINAQYTTARVIVYIGADTKGTVFAGPGYDANIMLNFIEQVEVS